MAVLGREGRGEQGLFGGEHLVHAQGVEDVSRLLLLLVVVVVVVVVVVQSHGRKVAVTEGRHDATSVTETYVT